MTTIELTEKLQQDALLASLLPFIQEQEKSNNYFINAADLVHNSKLVSLINQFASHTEHPHGDIRAIASLWSRWHFWAVLPAQMAALCLHLCLPKISEFEISADHKTCGARWQPNPLQIDPKDPQSIQLAADSIIQDFAILIESLSAISSASIKVFWNNLGNLFEYTACELRTHPKANQDVLSAYDAIIFHRKLSDGSTNPIRNPVRYVSIEDDKNSINNTNYTNNKYLINNKYRINVENLNALHTKRIRKICCLKYLLPSVALCANCPSPKLHHVSS